MYLQHFGMQSMPFALTPNTGFFLGLAPHVEGLAGAAGGAANR